jgi:hypothetical protein
VLIEYFGYRQIQILCVLCARLKRFVLFVRGEREWWC